jgi:hypothetical protein
MGNLGLKEGGVTLAAASFSVNARVVRPKKSA